MIEGIKTCSDYHKMIKNDLFKGKEFNKSISIIQVGDNAQSNSYIKYKMKDCEECGIKAKLLKLNEDSTNNYVAAVILGEATNKNVCGIIVQLPLPERLNTNFLLSLVPAEKDIDGFIKESDFTPCTAKGVMDWIKFNDIDLTGKVITLIGRGKTAGNPLREMLLQTNATTVFCNSKTPSYKLKELCKASDIIISAAGVEGLINKEMISPNTICIDIGRGDFEKDIADLENVYLTPKIGGVGLLTRTALLQNIMDTGR